MMIKRFLLTALLLTLSAGQGFAAGERIDVTAQEALEWHRDKGYVVARGDAVVTRGTDVVKAPLIKAFLAKGGANKIDHVEASGGVTITSADGVASAPHATYTVTSGIAELFGGAATLQGTEQTVTAQDKITYDSANGTLTAFGNATATRKDGTLITGNTLTAHFTKNETGGGNTLSELEGSGGVTIKTSAETLTAGRAVYKAAENKAYAYGNVKIVRGKSTIEGDRAEVNLTTKVSNIYSAGKNESSRVHGVFYSE